MKKEAVMPFKEGDEVEARSFDLGFRGAWFRCKVVRILKSRELTCWLDYYDFTDDTLETTKVYQLPPLADENKKASKRDAKLMLRPRYPTIYKASEAPNASEITEVAVVVDDTYKVGDLVDWWSNDSYWSGRIMKFLDDGKLQIDLMPKPLGEGESYNDALLKDVRPSLDWSVERGWTLPKQKGAAGRACAKLIKPLTGAIATEKQEGSSAKLSTSLPSNSVDKVGTNTRSKKRNSKRSSDDTVSKEGDETVTNKTTDSEDKSDCQVKKLRTNEKGDLRSKHSDTIEASVLDLEEALNKVKWLKRILLNGISPDEWKSRWAFVNKESPSSDAK